MTANGNARRDVVIRGLEVVSNLLYLIRNESDDQLKVTEYATLAEAHIKAIVTAFN